MSANALETRESGEAGRLLDNYRAVRERIEAAAVASGRSPESVRLVVVTKRRPAEFLRPLIEAGHRDFGENYPQELWAKSEELADASARWHLIGHLQTNKAKRTYPMTRLVHAVDSLKLLRLLDDLAADLQDPAPVCLQVNCSDEEAKHGWSPEVILEDADPIAALRRIRVVGLMTMAGYGTSDEQARPAFERLRSVRDSLRDRTGLPLPELSMGMSGDFRAAIAEGSTLVRVGSAIFEGIAR